MTREDFAHVRKNGGKDHQLLKWANEIRIRAERRTGELLALMEKQHGARGKGKKVGDNELRQMADRIQARAIARAGAILQLALPVSARVMIHQA
jgi:hypothetical protein